MGKLNEKGLEMKLTYKKEMKEKRKNMKDIIKAKRAKLIVKNLPFKTTEQNLKEHFAKYGEVESVTILKKSDGKMVGCAFIQFKLVQKAAKAKFHLNSKVFLDRVLEVDFAKPKNKYEKEQKAKEKIKSEECNDIDLSIIKVEDEENTEVEIKNEEPEVEKSDSEDNHNSEGNDSEDSDNNSESDNESNKSIPKLDVKDIVKKPHVSNDISEGKTVFIKNLPFSATKDDLKECMSQFGSTYYALICIDSLTEHSKGTGFVKFRLKDDAEKCLQAGTELTLQGNILDCHPAINKNDLIQKSKEKNVKQKDSRNLYLVKEGVIFANTKASEGVSSSDMAKRLQLEQYKTQVLRNLNMYISRTRLIIHNLPPTWDDAKLKSLFKNYSNPTATIREARIIRTMKDVDVQGIGISKGYGFVTFTTHEEALKALRILNNNPKIFAENKRPIVAFSIENRSALKAKEKRLERSKLRNPNSKNFNSNINNKTQENLKSNSKIKPETVTHTTENQNGFTGVVATPGVTKMRNRFKLNVQAKLHFENIKNEKKQKKRNIKTLKEKQLDFRKQPKQKINKKEENDNFSVLVSKYKQNLKSAPTKAKASKWYE